MIICTCCSQSSEAIEALSVYDRQKAEECHRVPELSRCIGNARVDVYRCEGCVRYGELFWKSGAHRMPSVFVEHFKFCKNEVNA